MVEVSLKPYTLENQSCAEFTVVTCFLECNGQVMLLQRARKDAQHGLWGIPGGKLDKNELPRDGLSRELYEELQFNVPPKEFLLLDKAHMGNPFDGAYLLYLYYFKVDQPFKAVLNNEEHYSQKWVDIDDFLDEQLLVSQGQAFEYVQEKLKAMVGQQSNLALSREHSNGY